MAWGRGQFVALVIAVLSAWANLHWGLVPITQARAAYVADLWPFFAVLLSYLIFQVVRAPYALDRSAHEQIGANLQRESFNDFLHETNPANGLVIDKTAADWPASIAATGFALTAYPAVSSAD